MDIGHDGLPGLHLFFDENGAKLASIIDLYALHARETPVARLEFQQTKADREIANALYNRMVLEHDARINGRKPSIRHKGRYVHYIVGLAQSDSEWIHRTTVSNFLERVLHSVQQIVDSCKSEARNQEDILTQLAEAPIRRHKN